MNSILIPVMALAISMVVIPVMLRVAPALGLVDRPSARKVHSVPMARVGGWGIVLGAVVPVMVGLSLEEVESVLVAVAPIIGAPKVIAASDAMHDALGFAVAVAEADLLEIDIEE